MTKVGVLSVFVYVSFCLAVCTMGAVWLDRLDRPEADMKPQYKYSKGQCLYFSDSKVYGQIQYGFVEDTDGSVQYGVVTSVRDTHNHSFYTERTLQDKSVVVDCDGALLHMELQDAMGMIKLLEDRMYWLEERMRAREGASYE